MIIDKEQNTSIITQEKATIVELVKKIEALYPKFKNDNIIVKLSSLGSISLQDVIEFLRLSNNHRAAKLTFVVVTDKISSTEIPEEIVVVPTVKEAFDIIEMEEMERDLEL
ncbi:ribonuclease Z [Bizionia gelidisalsuginis]|uniref:Ribonuclease Z n=2 Tax=Bizionia TaxID=283785 RepID=A0A8H2LKZ8_9FLAO|nr:MULTISPECIES: ribonuclease Z [Bizionia]TYB72580.1 ribonuclease Z [Bizionia saleffrena]TYC18176.1 ribonuclease Z [Bizionia gelidisalsuginis]